MLKGQAGRLHDRAASVEHWNMQFGRVSTKLGGDLKRGYFTFKLFFVFCVLALLNAKDQIACLLFTILDSLLKKSLSIS